MPWGSSVCSKAPSEHALWIQWELWGHSSTVLTPLRVCFLLLCHCGSQIMGLAFVLSASQALILLTAWPYLQEIWELLLHQHLQLPLLHSPIVVVIDLIPVDDFDDWADGCFQVCHGGGVGLPCSQDWYSQR